MRVGSGTVSLGLRLVTVAVALAAGAWASGVAAAQQVSPPARVVLRADGTTRHVVHMSPGYNVFLVFDAPVEFVAVGDERLVSVYLRGDDGIVGLRSSQQTGRTNLHVYAGGILVPFEVIVSRAGRTADVVLVSVKPAGAPAASFPARQQRPQQPSPSGQSRQPAGSGDGDDVSRAPAGDSGTGTVQAGQSVARVVVPRVQVLDSVPDPVTDEGVFQAIEVLREGVRGVFQAYRTEGGLAVWYQLTNLSGDPRAVYPERVLVKLDGRVVRWDSIRRKPASQDARLLPHGGVEVGVISLGQVSRSLELVFPVFGVQPGLRDRPVILDARFDGLDQLPRASRHS